MEDQLPGTIGDEQHGGNWDELGQELNLAMGGDPAWAAGIPAGILVGVQFKTLVNARSTEPETLMHVARIILFYIRNAQGHNKENVVGHGEDLAEAQNMLKTFEICFNRIVDAELQTQVSVAKLREDFFEFVWKFHLKKQIDFRETNIISTLMQERPGLLEPLFIESLQKWKPSILASVCSQNAFAFQVILDYLRQAYTRTPLDHVLEFSKEFLKCTNKILGFGCVNQSKHHLESGAFPQIIQLYPVAFRPILDLVVQLKSLQLPPETSALLTSQMEDLMNEMYKSSPDDRRIITFVFTLYEPTKKILCSDHQEAASKLITHRYLWQAIHKYY